MAFVAEHLSYIQCLQRRTITAPANSSSNENDSGSSSSSSGGNNIDDSDEYTTADYPGILNSDLTTLTPAQRVVFITTVCVLCVLSTCGNIGTLHVNFRRKMRPFFRACLISLALSDLLNTVFLTMSYLGQFLGDYVQVWLLGRAMCNLVPLATTVAILASSMTLVGIALDRYFAVMKAVINFWNPGVVFCVFCMLGIWTASLAIASPVFRVYDLYSVYVLAEEPTARLSSESYSEGKHVGGADAMVMAVLFANRTTVKGGTTTTTAPAIDADAAKVTAKTPWETEASQENLSYTLVEEQELVKMCISNQEEVAFYYMIVFVIIFVPCIVAFVWLNGIIAKNLWIRRRTASSFQRKTKKSKKACKSKLKSSTRKTCIKMQAKADNSRREILATTTDGTPSNTAVPLNPRCKCHANAQNCANATTISTTSNNTQANKASKHPSSKRESRHLRMFTIVVLLMAVFLLCRLPAWIFLIMRMYGSYGGSMHWIVYFSLGILNLASCVLNPLFYTFLAETIQCALFVKVKVFDDFCGLRLCCKRCQPQRMQLPICAASNYGGCGNSALPKKTAQPSHCFLGYCNCIGCTKSESANCAVSEQQQIEQALPQWGAALVMKTEHVGNSGSNDKDEGVECSDASDDGSNSLECCDCDQHIYTIFPSSLVSSSVTSDLQN